VDEQLSLFESSQELKNNEDQQVHTKQVSVSLNIAFRNAIDRYLSEGLESAMQMAERLLKEEGAPKERLITGKPKIYIDVCQYLDSLNNVQIIEDKVDKTDRIYRLIK